MTKLRFVQVGMGGWGQNWALNAIPRAKSIKPAAWVDAHAPTLDTARKLLDLPTNSCFTDLSAAFAEVDADAVVITANLTGHIPIALAAIKAGKHVLVEKPFAPTLAEAKKVVAAAAAANVTLMVSQNYRFQPAPRVVTELIASGELGPVGSVAIDFRRDVSNTDRPKHYQLPDPLLVDMAVHHFDLLRMVFGEEPTSIACQTWNPTWSEFSGDASGAAQLTFASGIGASWRGSWVSPGEQTPWAGEWRIECEKGEIQWASRDDVGAASLDYVTIRTRSGKTRKLKMPEVKPFGRAGALTHFANAIRTQTEPETSGRDNLGTLAMVYSAVSSAATGKRIMLK